MPRDSVYEAKITQLQSEWDESSSKIFEKLREITKLEWRDKDIRCYVVSGTQASFSHPLTLKLYDEPFKMFDTFVHELMHRLLHNPKHPASFREARKRLLAQYEDEPIVTKNHIILHALHAQLALELFGEERMEIIIGSARSLDYIRAWQIVEKHGREKILEEMFGYKVLK